MPTAPRFVRYWSNSGQRPILARDGLSAIAQKRTLISAARVAALLEMSLLPRNFPRWPFVGSVSQKPE
jgi:hypothetical protein